MRLHVSMLRTKSRTLTATVFSCAALSTLELRYLFSVFREGLLSGFPVSCTRRRLTDDRRQGAKQEGWCSSYNVIKDSEGRTPTGVYTHRQQTVP